MLRLWREKRGEVEPEELSGNLVVQLGLAYRESLTGTVVSNQLRSRSAATRFLYLPPLSQPDARSAAVLIDELHALALSRGEWRAVAHETTASACLTVTRPTPASFRVAPRGPIARHENQFPASSGGGWKRGMVGMV